MLMRIARAEGTLALFAGVAPRLAKVAPSCAIMIASYEMGKTYFGAVNRDCPFHDRPTVHKGSW